MLRGAHHDAGSALCASSPREAIIRGRLAPSISRSRLNAASARRRRGSRKFSLIAVASSADGRDPNDDAGTTSSSSSPPPAPPSPPPPSPPQSSPLASNPFYSFMTSTPASRAAAASGTSLAPAPRPARVCRRCDGRGDVECAPCSGRGALPRGGYSRKNALNSSKAVGTTWTALQRTLGRTHFDCRGKRVVGGVGGGGEAEAGGAGEAEVSEDDDGGGGTDGKKSKKKKKKKKKNKGGQTYYLMVATCDDEIRLWVPGTTLKDRKAWAAGWLARDDLDALRREVNGGDGGAEEGGSEGKEGESGSGSDGESESSERGPPRGASCKKCEGTGRVPCPLCSRAGEMIHV